MKAKPILLNLLVGVFLITLISNCSKKEESPNPWGNNSSIDNPTVPPNEYTVPAVTFSAPVMGFVEDINGNPVQGAIVSTGSKTFTTDENGAFKLDNAPFTGDFCYIKAIKKGFFTASNTVQKHGGNQYATKLVLMPQDNIQTYTATEAKTISLQGGAQIDFPAEAIKTLSGAPYTGQVHVAVAHLDPAAPNFSDLIPGGDLRGYSAEGNDVQLYSYGMLNVELRDDAGNYLQLAEGKKATLTMPVPAAMSSTAPATIPLWYFDENKGVWIEEGEAKLQNGKYIGTVSHFTPWNCDWRGPRATVKGKFIDCDGVPVSNILVKTDQATAQVDENGNWQRWVPAGMEIEVKAKFIGENTEIDLSTRTPKLTEGQVFDLSSLKLGCLAKIVGEITDCNGDPFEGYALIKVGSVTIRTAITNGKLRVLAGTHTNQTAEIFFHQPASGELSKIQITLPAKEKKLDLGTVKACPAKKITPVFSFDYDDGTGTTSSSFTNMTMAEAVYVKSMDVLRVTFEEKSTGVYKTATLSIKSPKLGPVPSSSDSTIQIIPGQQRFFYDKNISFNLLKYEGEGGEVSGTFSGDMLEYQTGGQKTIAITNGKFTAVRLPDQ